MVNGSWKVMLCYKVKVMILLGFYKISYTKAKSWSEGHDRAYFSDLQMYPYFLPDLQSLLKDTNKTCDGQFGYTVATFTLCQNY